MRRRRRIAAAEGIQHQIHFRLRHYPDKVDTLLAAEVHTEDHTAPCLGAAAAAGRERKRV